MMTIDDNNQLLSNNNQLEILSERNGIENISVQNILFRNDEWRT